MTPGDDTTTSAARRQIGVGGFRITPRAKQLVQQVLDSNRLTAGPMMERFESMLARAHDCRWGLMCNSGTGALQIALAALRERHGWKDGDEVIVPALTFIATSNVVLYNGLRPVFVDVGPDDFEIDPAKIEDAITDRTRCLLPVHIGGQPCDMDPILEIAARRGLRLVEDTCETMFARYKGRSVGSFGDVGCFSTYAAHIITTGVGGVCTTNDDELFVMLKSLMNHGRDAIYIRADDDAGAEGEALFAIADRRFSFVRLGQSFRATEMEAAIGVAQIEEIDGLMARRRAIAARYDAAFDRWADRIRRPHVRPDTDHSYMFYPLVIVDPALERDDLVRHLEENGVETRYLLPLINQPVYRRMFGDLDARFPVAAMLNSRAFYIGCHPEMTDDDVGRVIEVFEMVFGG